MCSILSLICLNIVRICMYLKHDRKSGAMEKVLDWYVTWPGMKWECPHEWWVAKDVVWGCSGLVEGTIHKFAWRDWGKPREISISIGLTPHESAQVYSVTAWPCCSMVLGSNNEKFNWTSQRSCNCIQPSACMEYVTALAISCSVNIATLYGGKPL